jgi:hypothetical protein
MRAAHEGEGDACEVFSAVFRALRAALEASATDWEFLESVLNDVFLVIVRFILVKAFNAKSLVRFYDFLRVVTVRMKSRVIMRMHRPKIRSTIQLGIEHDDPNVSRKANEVRTFLRNYKDTG